MVELVKKFFTNLTSYIKKVAKIALGVEKTDSSLNVYRDINCLPLHLRCQVHLSLYMVAYRKSNLASLTVLLTDFFDFII